MKSPEAMGAHCNTGADYAVDMLGYDRSELDDLPNRATARFAGVGNPHRIGKLEPGETVVVIGSGSGLDLLIAADRVGPTGRAIGIDPTAEMREESRTACVEAGVETRVRILEGSPENIPLPDNSVDVAISNGAVFEQDAFLEIYRVLVPGGRLHLAALLETEIIEIANNAGFGNCRIVEQFVELHAANFFAQKITEEKENL